MVVVVLTGGIGSGKSAAAEFFEGRGAHVIDLDDVATVAMGPGSPVLASVAAEFGARVLAADGSLDRAALASACFGGPDATRRLDAIVHPAVALAAEIMLDELRALPEPPRVTIVEVPLLAEAPGFAELGDIVVAITAPEATRANRAIARGMARSDALRRMAVQAPDSARAELADVIIENDGTMDEYFEALGRFWDARLSMGGSRA